MELKDLAQKIKDKIEEEKSGSSHVYLTDIENVYGEAYEISWADHIRKDSTYVIEIRVGTSWFFSNAFGVVFAVTGLRRGVSTWLMNQRRYIDCTGNYGNVYKWVMDNYRQKQIGAWKSKDKNQGEVVKELFSTIKNPKFSKFRYFCKDIGADCAEPTFFSPYYSNIEYRLLQDNGEEFTSVVCEMKVPQFNQGYLVTNELLCFVVQVRNDKDGNISYWTTWKRMVEKPVRDLISIETEKKVDNIKSIGDVLYQWLLKTARELKKASRFTEEQRKVLEEIITTNKKVET